MPQLPDLPLDGLFGQVIMDHYRNPRNRAPVASPDIHAHERNPFCGDAVTVDLKLDNDGRVVQVSVQSEGCSILQATASLMSEALLGKTLEQLLQLSGQFRDWMQGRLKSNPPELEPMQALQVVRQHPVRIKCALLPWTALEVGAQGHRQAKKFPLLPL